MNNKQGQLVSVVSFGDGNTGSNNAGTQDNLCPLNVDAVKRQSPGMIRIRGFVDGPGGEGG
jgi:hypothetical protein